MKIFNLVTLFVTVKILVFISPVTPSSTPMTITNNESTDLFNSDGHLFKQFRAKYGKSYQPGSKEYYERFVIFRQTLERLRRLHHARKGDTWSPSTDDISEFADLTPEEFKNRYFSSPPPKSSPPSKERETTPLIHGPLPSRVDWREKGIISPVRNQGKCGACWAYSTVEVVESMAALFSDVDVIPLSVQQIMDCATANNTKGTHGCEGGDTCSTLRWMAESGIVIEKESEYPPRTSNSSIGPCERHDSPQGFQVVNYTCENFASREEEMVRMLATVGPLVAAVDASSWQDYLGGVIQWNCEAEGRNHAVQIVGYDLTNRIPHYIVKNTWGPDYGREGFLYIAIGRNLCGIAEEVSSIQVKRK